MTHGKGLFICVNANAKRGGRRIAVQIARALPGATRSAHAHDRRDRGLAPVDPATRAASSPPAATARPSRCSTRSTASCRRASPSLPSARFRSAPATRGRTRSARASSTPASARSRATRGPIPTKRYGLFRCDGVTHVLRRLRVGRADPRRLPQAGEPPRRRVASRRASGATSARCSFGRRRRRCSTAGRTSSSRTSATRS